MTKSTIYTFSKCDEADGYFLANCECVCTQTCSDKVTSKPEHSQYVEVDCTACGVTTKIKDHWECDDGYQKSGNSCVLSTCPVGFARNVADCGQSGGWSLDTSSQSAISGCYKCSANACPLVAVSGFGSGSATRDVQSTISNNVANCGNYAGDGWNVVATGKYSGDNQCYVCQPKSCPIGYKSGVSSVADCGAQAANGWDFSASNLANGNDPCGKCSKLKCQNGYSSSVSAANCKPGESFTSLGFSGDSPCGKCVEKDCSTGYSKDIKSVADCGNGSVGAKGWIFSSSNGCGKCTAKTCSTYGYRETDPGEGYLCKTEQVLLGNANSSCYNCISCDDSGILNGQGLPVTSTPFTCHQLCHYHTDGTPSYYSAYQYIEEDKEGRRGTCWGWVFTPGAETTNASCCCAYGDAQPSAVCMEK